MVTGMSIAGRARDRNNGPERKMLMSVRARVLPLALAASVTLFGSAAHAAAEAIEVWKSATCSCCEAWVEHLDANGFAVTARNVDSETLQQIKRQAGLSKDLASCHTGKIGGYVIEGHVPAGDVKRLLAEKPEAVGLTVPGMPVGSPGMEGSGETEPYDVLLVKKDGTTEIFSKH
jgi:hypothetical protein